MNAERRLTLPQAMQQAAVAYNNGDWANAEQLSRFVLNTQPDHFGALHLLGIITAQMRRPEEAAELLARAVSARPSDAQAHNNYGNVLNELKRFNEALDSYTRALQIQPAFPEAHNNLGAVLHVLRRFEEALNSYARALTLKPEYVEAWYGSGHTLRELSLLEAALSSYGRALQIKPDFAEAHSHHGDTLMELKRFEDALDSYTRALTFKPDYPEVYNNRGNTLRELKRYDEALDGYSCALRIKPDFAEACNNRGVVLQELKRYDEALDAYSRALQIKPDFAEAHNNRGNTMRELKRFEEALESYARALQIKPAFAEAHSNRSNALRGLGRFVEALDSCERALQIKRDFAEAYNNRGAALQELKRFEEALDSYVCALQINPDYAEAYGNRGDTLLELKRFEDALDSYTRALRINPDSDWLLGTSLHAKAHLCDWSNWHSRVAELTAKITQARNITPPFPVLALIDRLPLQRQAAQIWVRERYSTSHRLPPIEKRARHERIRIGYFSGDYRNHPVSLLTAEMFERRDPSGFEVTAYSFGPDTQDEMRKRMERAFDRFIDVRGKSDLEIVQLARNMELDIAVDLAGFTEGCRPNVLALRAAPLQVSYLGYLGTLGAAYMDYMIADATLIPLDHQQHYDEKIVYLQSYQANDSKRIISDRLFSREELCLPSTGFVFCCLNASYKIVPETFDSWMRILRQVEGSVLFLLADNLTAQRNLRKEAVERGVAADRLVFGKRLPSPEYLARYRTADLFLDTLPYNAGTTASDALRAGLPVLTHMGESFAARVAASVLNAIGLPELVTTTQEQYEATAINLALDPTRLGEFKYRLHGNRLTMPLFDTEHFTSNLENAYTQMYERYQADLSPDHIFVPRWRAP
jgi:predicted O-linked N-acetylglucosamine transferase (SPINDLY family)